jgi:hypothetical protein
MSQNLNLLRQIYCRPVRICKTGPMCALKKTGTKRLRENQNDE